MMHIVIEHIAQNVESVCACIPHAQAMDLFTTIDRPDRTEEMQSLNYKRCEVYEVMERLARECCWVCLCVCKHASSQASSSDRS
jgi:hypothetical protein